MKRYCKDIKLNAEFIASSMLECFADKWERMGVAAFLASYSNISKKQLYENIQKDKSCAYPLIDVASAAMAQEIKERKVTFLDILYSSRRDLNCGKMREIGVESEKQQVYDFVAVNGLKELFLRKIGKYQCASFPNRGQVYGKNAIKTWISKNPAKTRVCAKGDVHHCYPSINIDKLMQFLKKQVKNDDLLYLVEALISSYKQGLSIGSYLSQWLCNYFLSFAYHYAEQELYKMRKQKDGTKKRVRLIYKVLFYMDDILIIGSRKADVKKAMLMLVKYFKDELGLEIKPDWILFLIDCIGRDKKHHGSFIDMMGYKIYRDHVEIRRRIFLKSRRVFRKAWRQIREHGYPTLRTARRCISYNGWFKNSDSEYFKKKYRVDELLKHAERKVRYASKVCKQPAKLNLATN